MSKVRCMGCMMEYDSNVDVCPHCGYSKDTPVKELYHLKPGTVLMNKYIVGQAVGFGGFGVTYIGWDKTLEKVVAIKEYLPSELATRMEGVTNVISYDGEKTRQFDAGLERFIDEARRLAKLNHLEGIVHIFDSFSENDTAYIVMEFLKGDSLKSILKQRGTLTYKEAIDIAIPVLRSLDEVHKKGIIHRDIAPDNIMITDDGRVKLIDFGAARYATTVHSKSLSVVLKPGYAPEEQYRSHGNQGPWSDVYAMGATLYRMITGRIPEESLERKANDKLQDISKIVPEIPKPCENAIMNALNVNAQDRIQSAKEFADALSGVSEVERNKVKQRQANAGKWSLKMKIIAAAVIVACVAVIGTVLLTNSSIQSMVFKSDSIELMGKTIEEANAELEKVGKICEIKGNRYDDGLYGKIDKNTIISNPEINDDSKFVKVITYAGKNISNKADAEGYITVPNFFGMSESDAKKQAKEFGLTVKVQYEENANYVGNVFKQSLEDGTKVKLQEGKKTTITVTVGKKPKPKPTTTVPETQPETEYQEYTEYDNSNDYDYNANSNQNYNSSDNGSAGGSADSGGSSDSAIYSGGLGISEDAGLDIPDEDTLDIE